MPAKKMKKTKTKTSDAITTAAKHFLPFLDASIWLCEHVCKCVLAVAEKNTSRQGHFFMWSC